MCCIVVVSDVTCVRYGTLGRVQFLVYSLRNSSMNNTTALEDILSISSSIVSSSTGSLDIFGLDMLREELLNIHLPGLVVSLPIIILAMASCNLLYRLLLTNVLPGLLRSMLLDFVSAGEATVVSWELITIFHQYGLPLWTVCAYLSMVVKVYMYRPECVACPYSHVMSWLRGYVSARDGAARVLAQIAGGSVFFRWQGYVWDLGLTAAHVGRSYWMSYGICSAWLSVPTWVGFLIECTGAMVTCLFGSLVFDFELMPTINIHKRLFVNAGVTMSLVLVAFYRTGGFLQPILAYARTFGCKGVLQEVSKIDHLLVYWVGPTVGAVVSMYLAPGVKRMMLKTSVFRGKPELYSRKYKTDDEEFADPLIVNTEAAQHKL